MKVTAAILSSTAASSPDGSAVRLRNTPMLVRTCSQPKRQQQQQMLHPFSSSR
jgi:hypothetical protein